ncbi:hypothetical protein Ae201684P_019583 [Aphanomyces euteiches]|nr:hypothetical protein Ae201684P_019583 [Aphanomyces euteiches]
MSFDAPFLRQSLLAAAMEGDLDAIVHALDKAGDSIGGLIDSVDAASGFTALHHVAMLGFVDIVCYLVRHGAAIDAVDKVSSQTSLLFHPQRSLARHHFIMLVILAATRYSNADRAAAGGRGSLSVFVDCLRPARRSSLESTAALRHEPKLTCLQTAAARGFTTIVRLLLLHGDVVDGVNGAGETALHIAAQYNHVDVAKVLVQCGATTAKPTTTAGDTVLHYACRAGSTEVAVFLVSQGLSIHSPNTDVVPLTSLDLARVGRHTALMDAVVKEEERLEQVKDAKRAASRQASLKALKAAKLEYAKARAAAAVERENLATRQRHREMEAIASYLKAIRHGESIELANRLLDDFPRVQNI